MKKKNEKKIQNVFYESSDFFDNSVQFCKAAVDIDKPIVTTSIMIVLLIAI